MLCLRLFSITQLPFFFFFFEAAIHSHPSLRWFVSKSQIWYLIFHIYPNVYAYLQVTGFYPKMIKLWKKWIPTHCFSTVKFFIFLLIYSKRPFMLYWIPFWNLLNVRVMSYWFLLGKTCSISWEPTQEQNLLYYYVMFLLTGFKICLELSCTCSYFLLSDLCHPLEERFLWNRNIRC